MTPTTDANQAEEKPLSSPSEPVDNPFAPPDSELSAFEPLGRRGKILGYPLIFGFAMAGIPISMWAGFVAHRVLHGNWNPGIYCVKVVAFPVALVLVLPVLMMNFAIALRTLSLIWPTQNVLDLLKPSKKFPTLNSPTLTAGILFCFRLLGGIGSEP